MLEIDSVIKSFGGRQLLTDIYLRCEPNDIIGILGRNGSGKSTLLKILFGVQQAERRFIRIDGKVMNRPYREGNAIAYLPQHNFLLGHITVGKAASLYLQKGKVPAFFDDTLLGPLQTTRVAHLSGGESRYLEVKLLLWSDARYIMLDEPFNGVAPVIIDRLKELIREASLRKGIVLTDHDFRNVLDVARKYCLLYDGGIKRITDKEELVRWNYITENQV